MAAEIRILISEQSSGGGIAAAKRDLNDLSNTARDSGGGFSAMREVATGALRAVGTMATQAFMEAGRAALGFFKDSISLAGNFEAGMTAFGAAAGQGFEAGSEQLDKFHDLFIDIGKRLPVSTTDVQAAALAMVKGGLEPATLAAGALESTLNFAAAAGMGLEQAAELTVKQLGTFVAVGATVEEQTQFMAEAQNLLVKAAGASTLNVDKLGDAMLQAGGQAQAAGLEYEDFVTTMGLISPAFGSAAEAGTSFKNFLVRLQPSTEKAKDTMIALGLATEDGQSKFYDAEGQFVGMRQASEMLQNAIGGLTDAERVQALQTIFGNDAMGAANALVNGGSEAYDAFAQKMEQANGVSAQAAATQQGFNFVMENIKGTIEALQIQIGEFLLPYLTQLVTTANTLVNAITGDQAAFDALSPTLQNIITTVQGIVTSFMAWLPTLQPIIDLISANLTPILVGVAGVLGVVVVAALASVIASFLAIAAPVAAAIAVIGLLYAAWTTNFAGIRTTVETVMAAVQVFIEAALAQILIFWQAHGAEIMLYLQTAWALIYEIFRSALELIRIVLTTVFGAIALFITEHSTEIQSLLTLMWENIKLVIGTALTVIQGIITTALQIIKGDWSGAWTTIKTTCATIVANIGRLIYNWFESVKLLFGGSLTALKKAVTDFFTAQYNNFFNGLALVKLVWDTTWNTLKTEFQGILGSIVGWIVQTMTGIGNAIRTAATGIIGAAASVGSGIVRGIIQGIKDGASSIVSAAKDAAMAALNAAKSALGIGSPSKVFAEMVGLPMAQGMAVGLGAGAPLVARAVEQTAGGAVGAGRTTNAQRYQTVNYSPTYTNVASADPGMDPSFARSLAGSF